MRDGFEFVPMHYPFYRKEAIKIVTGGRELAAYRAYIEKHELEKAEIIMPDLQILRLCPSLKYLKIHPSYNAPKQFDFVPLYEMPEVKSLNCQNEYYVGRERYVSEIDYSKIHGLISVAFSANAKTLNYNRIETLKSLSVGGFRGKGCDLTDLFCSHELDTLELRQCRIYSLNGIETSRKMQCLYIYYNRSLSDISALGKIKKTLKALRIENCPKIQDFSVLGDLDNLELLELTGSNILPNLDFIKTMRKLKTFTFDMNVVDGNLSPCLNLSYVHCERDRKNYNLKDKDLPKGQYTRGNENIEEWRRLE